MKKTAVVSLFFLSSFCLIFPNNGMIPFSLNKKIALNADANKKLTAEARKCCEKGLQELEKNDYNSALTYFQSANEIDPNNAYFVAMIGWAKEHLGDLNGAVLEYDRAIALNVTNVSLLLNKALVKWKLKLIDDAYKSVNTALLIDSTLYDAYILRSDFLYSQNKYSESCKNLNKAIELNSTLEEGYYKRGLTLVFMAEYKKAILDLSKSIILNKDSSESYYYRAYAYKMIGDTVNALKDYSQGIKTKPTAKLYYERALIYIQKNKTNKAINDLEKAEELEPSNIDIKRQLAILYFDNRDYEEAGRCSEFIFKLNKYDREIFTIYTQSKIRIINKTIEDRILKYR